MRSRAALAALLCGALLLGVLAGAFLRPSGETRSRDARPAPPAQPSPASEHEAAARPDVAGARRAALAFAGASQQWLYLDDAEVEAAIRDIATDAAAEALVRETVAEISVARDALVHAAGPVWWFVRPLASKVTVAGERARASVWVVTVLSAADVALPQADWLTLDLELVWEPGGWLLESIDDRPGPTPTSGTRDEPWQPEPFDEALSGFERVGSEVGS